MSSVRKEVYYEDHFGFLKLDKNINFDGGEIIQSENFEDAEKWIENHSNSDGFIYPPQVSRWNCTDDGQPKEKIPKTERPAFLHKLQESHIIKLYDAKSNHEIRNKDAGFIVHLLGYLHGTRLQFHDWWFDGRIPIKSSHNIIISTPTIEGFISESYKMWRSWEDEVQKLFLNILIMHSRAASYQWDWERFMIKYMVFDGLYKLATTNYRFKARSHKERFKVMLSEFSMKFKENSIERIYSLRNELFHETLWDCGQPCTAKPGSDVLYQEGNLSRINNRLIPAILGYKTDYIATDWECIGTFAFDKAPSANSTTPSPQPPESFAQS